MVKATNYSGRRSGHPVYITRVLDREGDMKPNFDEDNSGGWIVIITFIFVVVGVGLIAYFN
jgi:hypothetical protein